MGSGDGGMTTGTGMARDFPGTWSLDNFLRGGTEKKTNADGKNQFQICHILNKESLYMTRGHFDLLFSPLGLRLNVCHL